MSEFSVRPIRRRDPPSNAIGWVIVCCSLLAASGLIALVMNMPSSRGKQTRTVKRPVPAAASPVTFANFRRIKDGMTPKQVVGILGDRFTVPVEIHMESLDASAVVLQWEQDGGGLCQIGFMNGIVYSRIQMGLKD